MKDKTGRETKKRVRGRWMRGRESQTMEGERAWNKARMDLWKEAGTAAGLGQTLDAGGQLRRVTGACVERWW